MAKIKTANFKKSAKLYDSENIRFSDNYFEKTNRHLVKNYMLYNLQSFYYH
jgi:hypothetical protein